MSELLFTFIQDSNGKIIDAFHSCEGRDYKLQELTISQMNSIIMSAPSLMNGGTPRYYSAVLDYIPAEYNIIICDANGLFIETRKEPWRGLHRRTNQAVSSGAVALTSNPVSAGASLASTFSTHATIQGAINASATQQAAANYAQQYGSLGGQYVNLFSGSISTYQGYKQYVPALGGYVTIASTAPQPTWAIPNPVDGEYGNIKRIKHEGLRVGEIIAYRCWPIKHGFLWSATADRAWAPGEPMKAEEGHLAMGLGVYSFKEMSRVIKGFGLHSGLEGTAFGSVYLWGEIIEHEIGYRSEYASVRSIEFVRDVHGCFNTDMACQMKRLYRVENPEVNNFIPWPEEEG